MKFVLGTLDCFLPQLQRHRFRPFYVDFLQKDTCEKKLKNKVHYQTAPLENNGLICTKNSMERQQSYVKINSMSILLSQMD